MELLIALAFIGGVVYLVSRLKPGTPEDAPFAGVDGGGYDDPYEDTYGGSYGGGYADDDEPLPTLDGTPEWVTVRSSVPRAEAPVARALLEANGIATLMEPMYSVLASEAPAAATHFRLRVAAEHAEVANALLQGD